MLHQIICSNAYCRETQNEDYSGTTWKGAHAVIFSIWCKSPPGWVRTARTRLQMGRKEPTASWLENNSKYQQEWSLRCWVFALFLLMSVYDCWNGPDLWLLKGQGGRQLQGVRTNIDPASLIQIQPGFSISFKNQHGPGDISHPFQISDL